MLEEVERDCHEILCFLATFLCREGTYAFYDCEGMPHATRRAHTW